MDAELGTVADDLAQFFTGVRYRAVAAGVVRAGPELESAKSAAKRRDSPGTWATSSAARAA